MKLVINILKIKMWRLIMIFLTIILGCVLGAILGMNAPMISYTYSSYLAIAVIAALDSVFGGIASVANKKFDIKIFISGDKLGLVKT